MPLYHEEKRYEAPSKEERMGYQQKREEREYEYQPSPQERRYQPPQQERGYGYAQENEQNDQGFPDMKGVVKVEKSEKIINENGNQLKLTKLVKYMENGEIKTEISKSKL